MRSLETLFRALRRLTVTVALALPALSLAQASARSQQLPPGGTSSAWPLGLIVALVLLVALLGAFVSHRRAHAAGGGATRSGPR